MSVKVYVEGGGDHNKALETECRRGFSEFFERAGLKGRMPRVVACGSRQRAHDRYRAARKHPTGADTAVLLVDSEGPVSGQTTDDQIHFMVQAMEAWFYADKGALDAFYVRDFQQSALTQRADVENISKKDLFDGLKRATKDCQKGEYSKGDHSCKILALVDPAKVRGASSYAEWLLRYLDTVCE